MVSCIAKIHAKMLWHYGAMCLLSMILFSGCACDDVHRGICPQTQAPSVLVDLYHTRKQNHIDYRLTKGEYNYQGAYGYHRAFAHLQANGYRVDVLRSKPLDQVCLGGYKALFVNLLHDDRPDFSEAERDAIQTYVKGGGGLFVIADHTNVYRHAERLNPLLRPMGIEVLYHTAVDTPPDTIDGSGWIKVTKFATHPVTKGVRMISLQTGGPFRTDHGVAFTSTRSFADFWDVTDDQGFYGDWTYNGDPKREPRGPLAVVAASTYGKGRVVTAGDQNMFGDAWLHMGDNFRLFMNAMAWLTQEAQKTPHLADQKPQGLNISIDLTHNRAKAGRTNGEYYFGLFAHLNRDEAVTAKVVTRWDDRDEVWWFMDPEQRFSTADLQRLSQAIRDGKTVVVHLEMGKIALPALEMLATIAPSFAVESQGKRYSIGSPNERTAFQQATFAKRVGYSLPLNSTQVEVKGLNLASYRPISDKSGERYVLDVRSEWGQALLYGPIEGQRVDIARLKQIGKGRLIVFLQDGFWRGRTLGNKAVAAPTSGYEDARTLLYAFLDYLKQQHPPRGAKP